MQHSHGRFATLASTVGALIALTFCSCQSLTASRPTIAREPARLVPAQAGGPLTQQPHGPPQRGASPTTAYPAHLQPAPGRPVATAGYYPPALPYQGTVAMMPATPPQAHAAACPCCGPKAPFAFSDMKPKGAIHPAAHASALPGHPTTYQPAHPYAPIGGYGAGAVGGFVPMHHGAQFGPAGAGQCGPGVCGPHAHGVCGDLSCPYCPYDEYICDGGDNFPPVKVRQDWTVHGLEQEDTIVHFDTLDGRTEHAVSNKVCLYAPRFAAVRKVTGMEASEQADRVAMADKPVPAITGEDWTIVSDVNQPLQPTADLGINGPQSFLERQKGLTAETTRHLAQVHLDLLPYENLDLIRRGVMQNHEKLRLAQVAANAVVWTGDQAVQVVIDGKLPLEAVRDTQLGETVMYDLAGKPRMRIIKIADKSEAQPGDIVSFTLRFDNVGDQKVGNVTILDNLTTRLEYVEGSQESSHAGAFSTELNEGESLVLRWEVDEPLRVGEGGIIRFKARVR
jgi:uncharacterized repeat protein (TIGR01451 family)